MEKLFQKFEDWYGAKWAAQYGAFPRERVKATWAEELAGFAKMPTALADALQSQKASPYAPTLPEFLQHCRNAARRIGDPMPPALTHKLSDEEIERNRERIAAISAGLARKQAVACKKW